MSPKWPSWPHHCQQCNNPNQSLGGAKRQQGLFASDILAVHLGKKTPAKPHGLLRPAKQALPHPPKRVAAGVVGTRRTVATLEWEVPVSQSTAPWVRVAQPPAQSPGARSSIALVSDTQASTREIFSSPSSWAPTPGKHTPSHSTCKDSSQKGLTTIEQSETTENYKTLRLNNSAQAAVVVQVVCAVLGSSKRASILTTSSGDSNMLRLPTLLERGSPVPSYSVANDRGVVQDLSEVGYVTPPHGSMCANTEGAQRTVHPMKLE